MTAPAEVLSIAGMTEATVDHWRLKPGDFVRDVFEVTPDQWQEDVLNALAKYEAHVTVRACHGPGKSAVASWAAFWFMSCYFPARIPCTAPTGHQLEDILWAEMALWKGQMAPEIATLFRLTSERLEWAPEPKLSFAVARTARKEQPEALQGFHSKNMLFLIDEASGVPEPVFEVAQGALSTPGAKVLMTANPTRTSGYFFNSHNRAKSDWKCFRVSHEDSERVTDKYVEGVAKNYGKDSNVYKVRCLGEFPSADDDVLIPFHLVEASRGRDIRATGDKVWGLDVARFGDDRNALCKATRNAILEPPKDWMGQDTMYTANKVRDEYEATDYHDRPVAIYVDVIGIGAGVVDRLQELDIPAIGVNVAEAPSAKDRFPKLRDELYWECREFFERADCTIPAGNPHDFEDIMETFVNEATTPTFKDDLKIFVEKKSAIKKRGLRSPDVFESFMLTRYHNFSSAGMYTPATRGTTARREYKRQENERDENYDDFEDGIV